MENALQDAGKATSPRRIVIKLNVDKNLLMERIVNRRMCKKCGKIYNLKSLPPKQDGICDECKAELYQRSDDNEEVASKRFDTYNTQTAPLVEYYKNKGLLVDVDGNKSPNEIYRDILGIIGK